MSSGQLFALLDRAQNGDDEACEQVLLENLEREIERTLPLSLVLDFSGVTFMDSSGIAVVMRVRQRVRDLGGAVTLRGVRPQARKVLDAAGLDRFVTVE